MLDKSEKLAFCAGVIYALASLGHRAGTPIAEELKARLNETLGIDGPDVEKWVRNHEDEMRSRGLMK